MISLLGLTPSLDKCWASSKSHPRRIHSLWVLASGCVPRCDWTQHAGIASSPPQSSRRLSHHPNRLSSMSSLVPLDNFALISEMWLGYCTAQMAYIHIKKIQGFPWWMQCTALMPHPLQFANNLPSGLSRKSIPLQLGFQWILVSGKADRSLSWFWHLA